MSRAARETLPDYARLSYYQIWIAALEKLLRRTPAGAARRTGRRPRAASDPCRWRACCRPPTWRRRWPRARPPSARRPSPARFEVGDRVRTRARRVDHHTRLPGYAHGKHGVIEARARRACLRRRPCAGPGRTAAVAVPRGLQRHGAVGRATAAPRHQRGAGRLGKLPGAGRMTAVLLPGMPQACGEPVFAEPWQAQAFAMTLALHRARPVQLARVGRRAVAADRGRAGRRRCRPGRHLLPALAGRAGNAGGRQGRQLGRRAGALPRRLGPCGRPHAARPADRAAARGLLSGLSAASRRPRPSPSRPAALAAPARARRARPGWKPLARPRFGAGLASSFMVSAMRLRARSTSTTRTLTMSPVLTISRASLTKRLASWLTCTSPSWCTPRSTKAPNAPRC